MANNVVIDFSVDQQKQVSQTIEDLKRLQEQDKSNAQSFAQNNEKVTQSLHDVGQAGEKTHQKLTEGSKNSAAGLDKLVESGKNLALLAGVGFGLSEIIRFGEECAKSFAVAEKASQQLLFSLNNNADAQKRLIEVSKQIGKAVAIEPSVIQKQEAFLAVQGRTENQIKKTIQAAVELSAVTGEDLASSVFKLSATYEGNIGRLARIDSKFKDFTATELANGAAIDLVNQKFKGFAESTLNTAAGKLQQAQVRVEELKQEIGSGLAGALTDVQGGFLILTEQALKFFGIIDDHSKEDKINSLADNYRDAAFYSNELLQTSLKQAKIDRYAQEVHKDILLLENKGQSEFSDRRRELNDQIAQANANIQHQRDIEDAINKVLKERASIKVDGKTVIADPAEAARQAKDLEKMREDAEKERERRRLQAASDEIDQQLRTYKHLEDGAAKADDIYAKGIESNMNAESKKRAEQNKTFQQGLDIKSADVLAEEEKQKKIIDLATEYARQGADIIFSNQQQAIQIDADARIQKLEEQKNKELENKRLTAKQKEEIEKRYQKEEAKIKNEAAQKQRQAEIIQAQVNALLAITNIIATAPALSQPFLIAAAIATDALAIAAITSKPVAAYAKGKERVEGPGTKTSDSIFARLSVGERIVDAETNERYFPILSAIHNKRISAQLANSLIETPSFSQSDLSSILMLSGGMIDYEKLGASVAKHSLLIADTLKHRNRYDSREIIVNVQSAEENLRRR